MTLEGEGPSPDASPSPPVRTRWSEDRPEDDAELLPPYVPGAGTGGAESRGAETSSSAEPAFPFDLPAPEESAPESPAAATPAPQAEEPGSVEGEDFPFDSFDIGAPSADAVELAGELEQLAEALRREGRDGVERVLRSSGGVMALVAGVVAGYLAGRE